MTASVKGHYEDAVAQADRILDRLFPKWKAKYAAKRVSVSNEVPSPGPDAMAEALADPIVHRKQTVEYERTVIQTREIPNAKPNTVGAPGSPDLLTELRRQRGE